MMSGTRVFGTWGDMDSPPFGTVTLGEMHSASVVGTHIGQERATRSMGGYGRDTRVK